LFTCGSKNPSADALGVARELRRKIDDELFERAVLLVVTEVGTVTAMAACALRDGMRAAGLMRTSVASRKPRVRRRTDGRLEDIATCFAGSARDSRIGDSSRRAVLPSAASLSRVPTAGCRAPAAG
jgi:hypothetical protein